MTLVDAVIGGVVISVLVILPYAAWVVSLWISDNADYVFLTVMPALFFVLSGCGSLLLLRFLYIENLEKCKKERDTP